MVRTLFKKLPLFSQGPRLARALKNQLKIKTREVNAVCVINVLLKTFCTLGLHYQSLTVKIAEKVRNLDHIS